MREIKFRAWNTTIKEMVDLHKITPLALNMDVGGLYLPPSDGVVLMQYTGLKDMNGKESYHKDKIRDINTKLICTIEYGEYQGQYGTGFGWHLRRLDHRVYIPLPYDLKEWEIIGNIYEH